MKDKLSLILISVVIFLLIALFFISINTEKEFPLEGKISDAQPESYELDIPFTSQAPLGDWSPPFDHACEETSVLMAYYYFSGVSPSPSQVAADINKMVDFEQEKYGVYKDTSAFQTARLIKDYYGYEANLIFNPSENDIKKEILKGNVVIAPANGRALNNPYFTPPGPVYHMLVIKGYGASGFISNDPGTRRGKDYKYSYNVLLSALSDWENGALTNKPVIISVSP